MRLTTASTSPPAGHELGVDRRRDFLFLLLTLIVLATVVWLMHIAIWGIEVRRVPMVRVTMIIGVYMALMVRVRLLESAVIVVACVLIGDLYSRLLIALTTRWPAFWTSLAVGLALGCVTALLFAGAGSLLLRPPTSGSSSRPRD